MQVLAALCFLVLAHLPPLRGEVVKSFESNAQCLDFFYKRMVPKWDAANPNSRNTACLCQRFNNRYHFATLYNKEHRIAVYSAYLFQTSDNKSTKNDWCIEPQLVDRSWDKDMEEEKELEIKHKGVYFGQNQSLDEDYIDSDYDRGHLNPKQHHREDSRQATFTLTNVVPQNRTLNQGAWKKYETDLQKNLTKCSQAYVLVGAIPSKNNLINNRVNVPDYIWNAYCCLDNNGRPISSGGAIARNTENEVVRHTLSELKTLLKEYTKSKVLVLFRDKCEAKRSIIRYLGVC
ncbi:endonuclease domain-containing 1 protein-like [Anguilla anguilla]|uniref:endonuclease domain-containing 1 protein-like n=1 Tax=Anguilla anguilla TaxID=7936 RepID=UPI0015ABB14B|nr:endonuclease domain-containing 1 protein-like [Anguilla anguilla]